MRSAARRSARIIHRCPDATAAASTNSTAARAGVTDARGKPLLPDCFDANEDHADEANATPGPSTPLDDALPSPPLAGEVAAAAALADAGELSAAGGPEGSTTRTGGAGAA